MKRKTSFLAASAFVGAATFALSATAQQVAPSAPTATPQTQQTAPAPASTVAPASTLTPPSGTVAPPSTTAPQPGTSSTSQGATMGTSTMGTGTGTTTLTAADTSGETGVGMSPAEPRQADTVTVDRKLYPNRPLLITGAILLVGTYVPTAVVAETSGREIQDRNLLIPVVGPWMNLADRQCDGCENETGNTVLIVGSGVLQGAGALLGLASIFVPEKVAAATIQAGPMKLHLTPQVGRTGMGLGTVGVF